MELLDEVLATERTEAWSGVTIKQGVSFADLAVRSLAEGGGVELGALAYGLHRKAAATTAMVEQIQAWDHRGRDGAPTFAYWPSGSVRPESGEDTAGDQVSCTTPRSEARTECRQC